MTQDSTNTATGVLPGRKKNKLIGALIAVALLIAQSFWSNRARLTSSSPPPTSATEATAITTTTSTTTTTTTTKTAEFSLVLNNHSLHQEQPQQQQQEQQHPKNETTCQPQPRQTLKTTPIWLPSYPGSGAEMFRTLVRATTGLGGNEIYGGQCTKDTVTCKTHWPSISFRRRRKPHQYRDIPWHNTTIFLMRHPRNALPSLFNFHFEHAVRAKGHSIQAPVGKWRIWRDQLFDKEIEKWLKMIRLWRQEPYKILYMPYEVLTNETAAPGIMKMVLDEIRKLPGITSENITADEDIACIWEKIVKAPKSKTKRKRSYTPGYTKEQHEHMLQVLDQGIAEFANDDTNLVRILKMYREDAANNIVIDNVVSGLNETSWRGWK